MKENYIDYKATKINLQNLLIQRNQSRNLIESQIKIIAKDFDIQGSNINLKRKSDISNQEIVEIQNQVSGFNNICDKFYQQFQAMINNQMQTLL